VRCNNMASLPTPPQLHPPKLLIQASNVLRALSAPHLLVLIQGRLLRLEMRLSHFLLNDSQPLPTCLCSCSRRHSFKPQSCQLCMSCCNSLLLVLLQMYEGDSVASTLCTM